MTALRFLTWWRRCLGTFDSLPLRLESIWIHGTSVSRIMSQLPLFGPEERPDQASRLGPKLHALAERNVFFGTSSWKYEGWLGSIYSRDRYVDPRQVLAEEVRGRVPEGVCRDVPGRRRRLQLLPVPQPLVLAAAVRGEPSVAADSASRSPRRSPSPDGRATPGTARAPGPSTTVSWTTTCSTRCSPGRSNATATASPR